ncbi:MAG: phosphate acyltransferase [Saccharofermentanales bacterium]|jgi:phosphate butyryltransferase|nr:phosphate butyryltransferase [Clostridiaceae bacterium]
MAYTNFQQIIDKIQRSSLAKRLAVAAAHDEQTLKAVFRARRDRIVEPLLFGEPEKIKNILRKLGESIADEAIFPTFDNAEAARLAVAAIRDNRADILMKGKLDTAVILKAVVNKKKGLGKGRIMSMLVFHEIPSYPKLLAVTDGGMCLYPTLAEKKQILINAVEMMTLMGYKNPKVGVLASIEKVNPKMPETVDADRLKQMNIRGEITDCIVEGPISYDLAMSRESAAIKGFVSPVVGDVDLLVVPEITTGNVLGKCLQYSAGAKMAGIVVGAQVPIVLTSRGALAEEKYRSLALAAMADRCCDEA